MTNHGSGPKISNGSIFHSRKRPFVRASDATSPLFRADVASYLFCIVRLKCSESGHIQCGVTSVGLVSFATGPLTRQQRTWEWSVPNPIAGRSRAWRNVEVALASLLTAATGTSVSCRSDPIPAINDEIFFRRARPPRRPLSIQVRPIAADVDLAGLPHSGHWRYDCGQPSR